MEKSNYKELVNVYLHSNLKPQNIPKYTIQDAIRDYNYKSHKIKLEIDIQEIQKKVSKKVFGLKSTLGNVNRKIEETCKKSTMNEESVLDLLSNRSFDTPTNQESFKNENEKEESEEIVSRRIKKKSKKRRIVELDFLCDKTRGEARFGFDSEELTVSADEENVSESRLYNDIEEEYIQKDYKK